MTPTMRVWIAPGLLFAMRRFWHICNARERSHYKERFFTRPLTHLNGTPDAQREIEKSKWR